MEQGLEVLKVVALNFTSRSVWMGGQMSKRTLSTKQLLQLVMLLRPLVITACVCCERWLMGHIASLKSLQCKFLDSMCYWLHGCVCLPAISLDFFCWAHILSPGCVAVQVSYAVSIVSYLELINIIALLIRNESRVFRGKKTLSQGPENTLKQI